VAPASPPPSVRPRRWRRWLWRLVAGAAGLAAFYVAFLALGFVPLNRGYRQPAEDYVVIFVRSNEVHTDLVLPVSVDGTAPWQRLFPPEHFRSNASSARYIAFGWGNRKFYIDTPTWAEFRITTACVVLFWPSEAVLHVEYLADAAPGEWLREVRLTREQYEHLAEFVRSTVGRIDEQGRAVLASDSSYGSTDRFYTATGRYHCFNTCNQWTGRGLARAGVPVGVWTPLKPQVLCWLPKCAAKTTPP
jgi:uncharacterized protein (TIGR02117 family)